MMLSINCFISGLMYFLVFKTPNTISCHNCKYGILCKHIDKSCFINLHQNFVNDVSAIPRRCRCFFHTTVTIYHNDNIQQDSYTLNSRKTQQKYVTFALHSLYSCQYFVTSYLVFVVTPVFINRSTQVRISYHGYAGISTTETNE